MKAGALGPIGDGRQYMSWVGLDDALRALFFMMANPAIAGPVNVVSHILNLKLIGCVMGKSCSAAHHCTVTKSSGQFGNG